MQIILQFHPKALPGGGTFCYQKVPKDYKGERGFRFSSLPFETPLTFKNDKGWGQPPPLMNPRITGVT